MTQQAKLEIGSKEKVAYELMERIAQYEYDHNPDKYLKPDPRTYFLQLFNQCVRAADVNFNLGGILHNE